MTKNTFCEQESSGEDDAWLNSDDEAADDVQQLSGDSEEELMQAEGEAAYVDSGSESGDGASSPEDSRAASKPHAGVLGAAPTGAKLWIVAPQVRPRVHAPSLGYRGSLSRESEILGCFRSAEPVGRNGRR